MENTAKIPSLFPKWFPQLVGLKNDGKNHFDSDYTILIVQSLSDPKWSLPVNLSTQ